VNWKKRIEIKRTRPRKPYKIDDMYEDLIGLSIDQIVHHSHVFNLKGEFMRKNEVNNRVIFNFCPSEVTL
jgi:hypothetical protein